MSSQHRKSTVCTRIRSRKRFTKRMDVKPRRRCRGTLLLHRILVLLSSRSTKKHKDDGVGEITPHPETKKKLTNLHLAREVRLLEQTPRLCLAPPENFRQKGNKYHVIYNFIHQLSSKAGKINHCYLEHDVDDPTKDLRW